jgi:methylated-DNA-[protein]-cysteine S-methyltransferase
VNDAGAVVATAFGDGDALANRLSSDELERDPTRVTAAREQLLEYFNGKRDHFTLRLAPVGSDFQRSIWNALTKIPHGGVTSYGELAKSIGRAGSARAVGRANATNPICVIVPCHRVIGADGSLIGFAFGEDLKRRLLEHERALSGGQRSHRSDQRRDLGLVLHAG